MELGGALDDLRGQRPAGADQFFGFSEFLAVGAVWIGAVGRSYFRFVSKRIGARFHRYLLVAVDSFSMLRGASSRCAIKRHLEMLGMS